MFNCTKIPFFDLGFVQQQDNLWIKYADGERGVPHFAVTTTINPTSMTFLIKDLLNQQTLSTNSYDILRDFVISSDRESKLKKLLD